MLGITKIRYNALLFCALTGAAAMPVLRAQQPLAADTAPALTPKDTLTLGGVWRRSLIMPSYGQFFNRQYWKVPIVLGGIGGLAYGAYADRGNRGWYIAGAGLVYWASLLDAAAFYRYDRVVHSPSKAAIYSTLLPGLGQAYNQKYWKLPLIYGGFLGLGYLIQSRHFRLNLFGGAYNITNQLDEVKRAMASLPPESPEYAEKQAQAADLERQIEPQFRGLSADRLRSYKDTYRRDRDYYIILACLWYGLNIIDAVVDAHLFTYDISNDLSFGWSPYAERREGSSVTAGVSFSVRF